MIDIEKLNIRLLEVQLPYMFTSDILNTEENNIENKPMGNEAFTSDIGSLIRNKNELSFISNSKNPRLILVIALIIDASTEFNQDERNDVLQKLGMYDGSFVKSKKCELKGYEFRVNYSKVYGLMFQIFKMD